MPQTLISVIVCTYNGERFLNQTVESILNQTYKNFEIIIVDDGSTDGTPTLISKLAEKHSCIRPFFRTNHGLPASRTFAFGVAKGAWMAIIDQDDLCYPTRLAVQLELANANPDAKLVFCDTNFIDEQDNIIGTHLSKFRLPSEYLKRGEAGNLLLSLGCFIDSEACFIQREAAMALGPFADGLRYACDYDYFIRAGLKFDFVYTTEILSAWRIHEGQTSANFPKIRREIRKVYFNYLWRSEITWVTKIKLTLNLCRSCVGNLLDHLRTLTTMNKLKT